MKLGETGGVEFQEGVAVQYIVGVGVPHSCRCTYLLSVDVPGRCIGVVCTSSGRCTS
jgi:hypothetical protein